MNVDAIPSELRERPQWVTWRYAMRAGKLTKEPTIAGDERLAKSNDPGTWTTFEQAHAAVEIGGVGEGIGYVFSADDPYTGVDLDGCFDDDGKLASAAAAIVERLDSYTERSVSGRGLHVIVRGDLNGGRHRGEIPGGSGGFEVYAQGRYFVVTGDHLAGTPAVIEARQEELDETLALVLPEEDDEPGPSATLPLDAYGLQGDDEDLLERAFAARNGADVERLWRGDASGYPSRSEADLALCGMLAFWTGPDPGRLDALFRRSGLMRDKWNDRRGESTYGADTIARALSGRTDFYSSRSATVRPDAAADGEPVSADSERKLDDIGNARRFADEHHERLRYVAAWRQWLGWDERRWADDDSLEHVRAAQATARALARELTIAAADEPDEQKRKALLAHAARSQAEPRLRAMLALASADQRIVARPTELDRDPWLLCAENGVVDLRTGKLRPHRPGDLMTKLAGAPYDPDAKAPIWQAHLKRVLPDPEIVSFLQRLAGLSAIGLVREHVLALLVGGGANGKTVTRNLIARALGEYAGAASTDLLLRGRRSAGQATPELADLRGLRLVTVSETPEDGQLAGERAKSLTGGDTIVARRLHGNPFQFVPSHTIWILTNHRPRVPDSGHAMWRRILLIDFTVTIPPTQQDRDIETKLARELPGILRWIVDGARGYLDHGLGAPESVTAATARYRADEDYFAAFLEECTLADTDASARATDLLAAHNTWAARVGAPTLTRNSLADKLTAAGYERRRVDTGSRWYGLRLLQEGTLEP